jgi:hypothetical protein
MASNPPRPNDTKRLSTGSSSSQIQHRPTHPSGLRQAHMPPSSPEDRRNNDANTPAHPTDNGIQPIIEGASIQSEPTAMNTEGAIEEPEVNARTALLGEAQKYSIPTHENCGEENCNHGAMSPRPRHMRGYGSFAPSVASTDAYGPSYAEGVGGSGDSIHGVLGHALADSLIPRDGGDMSSAQFLEQRKKAKHSKLMYVGLRSRLDLLPEHSFPFALEFLTDDEVGTCSTTSQAQTGSDNTGGHSCRVTLLPPLQWPASTSPCRFRTLPT